MVKKSGGRGDGARVFALADRGARRRLMVTSVSMSDMREVLPLMTKLCGT